MFEKKETIFKKKDRATWAEIRALLKEEGFRGVRAGHYLQDAVMAGGCGAKLDPRNFGEKGRADHDIYYIRVNAEDAAAAREAVRRAGLSAEVASSESLMEDASRRAARMRTD